ncbi:hypothetical protein GQ43DRAFT_382687 [Delitschia confertaspora ATCC 74209]|uniref:Zn(2)-C6 fungal-type domain-containing protein n=1 Tax=Delitschia confertaspora ATCC 74209 TaxID=1513339 RepID=A0A9P4JC06_9PLEO|nr:hypothetical protein GQ43DRAFT_382687 [Delitschia confertaspora ATCC 74209]
MADTGDSGTEKPKNTRISQACVRCRSLKTRCLPSKHEGSCQRQDFDILCEWPEAQRRTRKPRGPSRISQVEHKIDGLVARFVNTETPKPSSVLSGYSAPSETTTSLPTPHSVLDPSPVSSPPEHQNKLPRHGHHHHASENFLQELARIHSFASSVSRPDSNLSVPPYPLRVPAVVQEPEVNEHLIKDLLETGEADSIFKEYRSMSIAFPFVPLPTDMTAQQLNCSKPMLLLAVLTVASWKNRNLQLLLEEVYRRELADRLIVRPRTSLSVLQSMLVYLYWYHFFYTPKSWKSILSIVQLAAGVALDLALHESPTRGSTDFLGRFKPSRSSLSEQREAERTWLGCYYICSSFAGFLQKPHLMKWLDNMADSSRRLKEEGEYPTDAMFLHLLTIRHIRDEIAENLCANEFRGLPISDPRIAMHIRYMETRLEEYKKQSIEEPVERVSELSYNLAQMELHSIGLHALVNLDDSSGRSNASHLNVLLSCLEAGRAFLDNLLALPTSDYHLISSAEWLRIPFVLMTLAKLAFPSADLTKAQWDVKAAQDRVRLDLYLESLCYRMQSLTAFSPPVQTHPDFWLAMKMIMDMTRGWYSRKIRDTNASATDETAATRPEVYQDQHPMYSGSHNSFRGPPTHPENFQPGHLGSVEHGHLGAHQSEDMGPNMPPPFMDLDFNMDQFLDFSLWGSGQFSPPMMGHGHFSFH